MDIFGGATIMFGDREVSIRDPDDEHCCWRVIDRYGDERHTYSRITKKAAIRIFDVLVLDITKENL